MKPPYKFSARTRVGFSDTDAQGIVYYGRYNPYFDLARVEYLRHLKLLHRREFGQFVMRANTVDYRAPAVFDDEIEVFVRVARIGVTSVAFEFAAYRQPDDVLMVTAEQTLVYVDLADRNAQPVPDWFREPVYDFEGQDCGPKTEGLRGTLDAVDRILNRGGDPDDVLRGVLEALSRLYRYAAIAFVEEGELALGPEKGERPSEVTAVPISFRDTQVAELRVSQVARESEEQAFLERVALLISPYCLVGWDTGGVPWSEVS